MYHDWKSLYKTLLEHNVKDNGKNEKRETNWMKYCRGLYDGLKYLVYDNGEEIINELAATPVLTDSNLEIISLISNQIHGLGFALTCDWIKECGCLWVSKPDNHIKCVVQYIKKTETIKDKDVLIFIDSWAKELRHSGRFDNISAYKIDKIIWLLCTGNFYLDDNKIGHSAVFKTIDLLR